MTTPEEAIQQSLQAVQGMHQQFEDIPPMADMPGIEMAQGAYPSMQQGMQGSVPHGTGDVVQQQILEALKTLVERVGSLAIAADRFSAQQQIQGGSNTSPSAPSGNQPTPAEREQAVEDFQKLTGKDIQKVADPMKALKTITQDRQEEAKQELDEKLQKGVITPEQHKAEVAKSNKQIERKTQDQAQRGVLNQEIQQAQIEAVNIEIDMAANKKGAADSKVNAIKEGLGTAPQPSIQQGGPQGGADTAKLIKQVGDQNVALLQNLLREKKLTDDELTKQSQMLTQIQQDLQTLMSQAEGQRQRGQRAGFGSR